MEHKVTDAFLDFAEQYDSYDAIPEEVIHEAKRILIDGFGNMLGGIASDKGKIGIQMAKQTGGIPQSTVVGVGGKYSAAIAAFANSELLNGLDWDPIPHIPPILVPSMVAVAEAEKVSGKKFLADMAVGTELARRLNDVFVQWMKRSIAKYGKNPDVLGNSNEHVIGTAIGNGLLMGLNREQLGHALGTAAYFCSLPVCRDWETTLPKSMIKYVPVSWLAQAGVEAAMLARNGYTSNPYTLDDAQYGFPAFYCREADLWNPDLVIDGLGTEWRSLVYNYKPYPCCRYLHSILTAFLKLQEKYHFSPKQITEIRCHTAAFVPHPDQYLVTNQIDAQFSAPYTFALVTYGYQPGPSWQDKRMLNDPNIREFMHKVKMFIAPEFAEERKTDPDSWYGRVEVDVDGKTYTEVEHYARGLNKEGFALSDDELFDRFRTNASFIIPDTKCEKAIDIIMHLEDYDNLDELMKNVVL